MNNYRFVKGSLPSVTVAVRECPPGLLIFLGNQLHTKIVATGGEMTEKRTAEK